MNNKSKIKILIVLGLGTLIWSGVCDPTIAADAPATMPQSQPVSDAMSKPSAPIPSAATQASKRPIGIRGIVAEVQALSSNGIPSSVVFTKEIVSMLTKHKISLPDGLSKLVVPKPPVPEPTGADVSRMYRQTHRIVSICQESTWTKIAHFGVSVSLRNDLLATIADRCPSSLARVEAAVTLARRATPGVEARRLRDIDPAVASKAVEAAITHALDRSSGTLGPDSVLALKYVRMSGLIKTAFVLKAMTLDKATKESLDKLVRDLNTMVVSAQQAAKNNKDAKNTLKIFADHLKRIGSQTEEYAKILSDMNALRPVLEAFFAVVNKEDTKEAERFLTKKTVALLKKEKISLRAWISNTRDVKEVRFVALHPIETIGRQYYVPIQFIVVDSNGKSRLTGRNVYLTRTGSGWLLGEK